jgi:hypothetical protein
MKLQALFSSCSLFGILRWFQVYLQVSIIQRIIGENFFVHAVSYANFNVPKRAIGCDGGRSVLFAWLD